MSECSQPESTNESADPSGDSSDNNGGEEWNHEQKSKRTRDSYGSKKGPRKPRNSNFRCTKCTYSTKYNSVLQKHIRKQHWKQIRSSMRTQKTRSRSTSNKSTSSLNNNSLTNGLRKVFVCKICETFSSSDLCEIKCHVYNDHLHKRENEIYAARLDLENENEDDESPSDEATVKKIPHETKGRKRKLSEINNRTTIPNKRSRLNMEKSTETDSQSQDNYNSPLNKNSRNNSFENIYVNNEDMDFKSPDLVKIASKTCNRGEKLECTECTFSSYDRLSFDRHNEEIHKIKIPIFKSVKKEPVSEPSSSIETLVESGKSKASDGENGSGENVSKNLIDKEKEWTNRWKSTSRWKSRNFKLFRRHNDKTSQKKQILKCPNCPFVARTIVLLNKHKELHKRIPGYSKCKYCSYNVKVKYALYVHEQLHVENQSEGKEFVEKEEDYAEKEAYTREFAGRLRAKAKIITKIPQTENYTCSDCPFSTLDSETFLDHCKRHITTGVDLLNCSNCSYVAINRNDLSKHKKLHDHTADLKLVFFCEKCPYATRKKENLDRHSTLHGANNFKFGCQFCNYFAVNYRFLAEHIKLHHKTTKNLVFSHSIDAFKNATKVSMKLPTRDVDICDEYPLYEHSIVYCAPSNLNAKPCSMCPHLSSSHEEYILHRQGHDSSKNFSFRCCDCDFGTKDREIFVRHVLCHSICDVDLMYDKLMRHEKPNEPSKAYVMGKAAMSLRENHSIDDWRKILLS